MRKKNRIQSALTSATMRQLDLAESLGTSVQVVNKWCRNLYQPDDQYVDQLCKILKVKKEELFYLE